MPASTSVIVAKDGAGTTITGGLIAQDKSGAGTGPFAAAHVIIDAQGVNVGTVKAASTAVAAGDTAVAVGLHPTSPLPAGTNVIGHVIVDTAPTTAVTIATAPALVAGVAIIGKVGIDQTTDGTTNLVRVGAETTKVIGVTRTADGSGNLLTSTGNALDINIKSGANVNGTAADAASAPVAFSTEGKAQLGSLTETAPASDTVSSGLNGRLQRIAQNITTLIAATLKVTLGVTATASGATASRVNAAASTNATSLKASAGQLYTIDVFNAAAYNVFLKLYNKASAPTVGTDTPVMTIPVQAGGGYSKTWPMGLPFATGIAYAITKLQADSDTTVVVAGDLTGNTTWI